MNDHTQTANKPAARRDQIAHKAYEIWQSEGCPHGCAADHWRKAEEQLNGQGTAQLAGQTNLPAGRAAESKATPPASSRDKSFARASR